MSAERRPGETIEDAARRVATDAVYAARDSGRNMHEAGAAAADAVLAILTPPPERATPGRRLEVRPVGTNGEPEAMATLFDGAGQRVMEIPCRYVKDAGAVRYVIVDLSGPAPLWDGS